MDEILELENQRICLFMPKGMCAKRTGLLNHLSLPMNEGLIYKKAKFFHTFGMHFPLLILCLDKQKKLIPFGGIVNPNSLFIAPQNAHYVVELNADHFQQMSCDQPMNQIKVFSGAKARMVYFLLKNMVVFFFLISIAFAGYCFAQSDEKVQLAVGHSKVIDLTKPPQSIQISDPDVIEVERVGVSNSIRVLAKQNGQASVTVMYSGGEQYVWQMQVGKSDLSPQESPYLAEESALETPSLRSFLKPIKGLQFIDRNGRTVILGKISKIDDFRHLVKIVAAHPEMFFPAFQIPESLENPILASLQSDLKTFGERNLRILVRNGLFTVTGVPSSPAGRVKIIHFLGGLVPNLVDSMSYFSGDSAVVQINLDFLEVGKSDGTQFGFSPGVSDLSAMLNFPGGVVSHALHEPALQIAPLSLFFKALENKNFAREIARPVVMTRSGEKASFLAGGEVPVVASMANGTTTNTSVMFKPFGILFNVTPSVQNDGSIWLKLDLEVSQVSEALSYQNIPGFTTRKINTNIILKEGTTAIFSGLVHDKDLKQVEKIPVLGSFPILGELLKSRRFQDQDTELWVSVTALRWNPEDQSLDTRENKILGKKFVDAKESTKFSLVD